MKRKMLGGASAVMTAAALAMPAGAQAQAGDDMQCGPTVQACVAAVVDALFDPGPPIDARRTIETVCDMVTPTGCS